MSQEIGLIPEDPEYENPFRKSSEDPDIKVRHKYIYILIVNLREDKAKDKEQEI